MSLIGIVVAIAAALAVAGSAFADATAPLVHIRAEADAADVGATRPSAFPELVPGQVLVRLREGARIDAVLAHPELDGASTRPTHDRSGVIARMRGRAPALGGRDAAAVFDEAYRQMSPRARRLHRSHTVTLAGTTVAQALPALAADPNVEHAEPNYLMTTTLVPNDPRLPEQWAHVVTEATTGWDVATGDAAVRIAVVDTGVDHAHPDLAANVWRDGAGHPGRDFVDIDVTAYQAAGFQLVAGEDYTGIDDDPADLNGHGTHVAGIAAAAGDNGTGVAGVCHSCSILPARAGFSIAFGTRTVGLLESDDIANAIVYAADQGAHVINMSFGGTAVADVVRNALAYAHDDKGVVLIGAAGNAYSETVHMPAGLDEVVAVAATAIDDARAWYSSFGLWIDVAAPGGDGTVDPMILSTVPPSGTLGDPSGYRALQGTSMAAPYVSGLAGLLRSRSPALTPPEVRAILRGAVDRPTGSTFIGTGRVNVGAALAVAGAPSAVAEIVSPASDTPLDEGLVGIRGTASGSDWVLEIADDPYAADWAEIAAGAPVVDDVLGTLDTATLAEGRHFIRLTVLDVVPVVDLVRVSFRWPVFTGAPTLGSPAVEDLDGDGSGEIVLATYASGPNPLAGGSVHAWRADGSVLPGWPFEVSGGPFPGSVAVGDLDADGTPEVVATGWTGVYALAADASPVTGWPRPTHAYVSPTLGDLDGDGTLEVLVPGDQHARGSARVHAWHHDGSAVAGWPLEIPGASPVAIAALDGDGTLALAFGTRGVDHSLFRTETMAVHVTHADGSARANWPQPTLGWVKASPVIGDLDGDGDSEIIVAAGGGVHAWHDDGTPVAGWPVALEKTGVNDPPILIDLEGDGTLEVVVSAGFVGTDAILEALAHDGARVAGWPVAVPPHAGSNYSAIQPVAADIDGDGTPEIVAKALDRVFAWHGNGSLVDGFPLMVDDQHHSGTTGPYPVVTDVDGDGTVEIVAAAAYDQVHRFDLSAVHEPSAGDWPMYQHDTANTGSRRGRCGDRIVNVGETCDDGGESALCDADCSPVACGDGIRNETAGEGCDDGNTLDGDCCDASCRLVPAGTLCDDGSTCTTQDTCVAGACVGVSEPDPSCRLPLRPGRAKLSLKDKDGTQRDALTWVWRGAATELAELGDPLSATDYQLCLYDQGPAGPRAILDVVVPPGGLCGGSPCWRARKTGYRFRDRTATRAPGIHLVALGAGPDGKARMAVKGRGAALALPSLPLGPRVTMQLANTASGLCWSAAYEYDIRRNDASQFKARSD